MTDETDESFIGALADDLRRMGLIDDEPETEPETTPAIVAGVCRGHGVLGCCGLLARIEEEKR